jgi:protein phosphatase
MPVYEHASRATKGARPYQEDTAAYLGAPSGDAFDEGGASDPQDGGRQAPLVAVLADGMGGHAGGSVASQVSCDAFLESYAAQPDDTPRNSRLLAALESSNAAVAERIAADPMLSGMGSTLVGVVFDAGGVAWISVGDSPLYLYRRGEVALLNDDHSLAPELDRLVAAGRISAAEAKNDPRRHMLRSAVCGEDVELIDIADKPIALAPGDFVILASDGLQTLESAEIARIVNAYGADGSAEVADALIRAVENVRDPHQDNATVIVVRPVFD